MMDSNIKLSDWKALDSIQDVIEKYRSAENTDFECLEMIADILNEFGFTRKCIDINCQHESDGQKWKKFFVDDPETWFLCRKCEQFYR